MDAHPEKPVTAREILDLIPRYAFGSEKFGLPISEHYRRLEDQLRWNILSQHELRALKKQLLALKKAA